MSLTRDPKYISSCLYEKDGKIFTKEKTIIEFPKYYEDKNLADIRDKTNLYGVFSILIGDKYSVSVIPTLVVTKPLLIKEVERDDMVYYNYIYAKNTCIIENKTVVKHKLLSYNLFESFFMLNKIPWYIEYEDLLRILDNFPVYADSNIGANFISNEIIVSFCTRNKINPKVFYRQNQNGGSMYVDLNDPYFSTVSTLNKVAGAYFNEGLVSAIVQKEEKPTKMENLVRQ